MPTPRDLANTIRAHDEMAEFIQRANQFNDTKTEAVKLCGCYATINAIARRIDARDAWN